jgi:hypothetical protein
MTKSSHISELCRTIGQLEGHIISLNENLNELKSSFDRMQRRLVAVEKQHSFIRGSVAAFLTIGAILGVAVDQVVKWVMGR